MKRYALLGYPLGHSLSPVLHKYLFETEGLSSDEFEYKLCESEKISDSIEKLFELDGFNITIPHKIEVIKHLDRLDSSALKCGAVNCVHKTENGEHIGYNTDCYGFLRALENAGMKLCGKVLLLGLGGAGKMMLTEALERNCEVTVLVRDKSKYNLEELSKKGSVKLVYADEIDGEFNIMLNSTPIGMFPKIDGCPVSVDVIKNCENIFDAVYNPIETVLMKEGKKLGKNVLGGMSMLAYQAVVSHEIWSGASYKSEEIDDIITKLNEKIM